MKYLFLNIFNKSVYNARWHGIPYTMEIIGWVRIWWDYYLTLIGDFWDRQWTRFLVKSPKTGCQVVVSHAAYHMLHMPIWGNHATWNQNKCQLTEPFPSAIFSKNPKQKNLYSSTVPTDENFFFGFLPKNALSDDSAFWIFPWDLPIRVKFRRNN